MTTPTNEIIKSVVEHPKTSIVVLTLTGAEKLWFEWGSWIVDAAYSVSSLVLVLFLIRRQIMIYKKDKLDKGK